MKELETYKKALQKISEYGVKPTAESEWQRIKRLKSIADKALWVGSEQRLEAGQHETIVVWHSVEKQLPYEHEDVLVYYYGNRDSKFFPECRYIKQSCYYDGEFECEEEVTHWAKIPDPPQDT